MAVHREALGECVMAVVLGAPGLMVEIWQGGWWQW